MVPFPWPQSVIPDPCSYSITPPASLSYQPYGVLCARAPPSFAVDDEALFANFASNEFLGRSATTLHFVALVDDGKIVSFF